MDEAQYIRLAVGERDGDGVAGHRASQLLRDFVEHTVDAGRLRERHPGVDERLAPAVARRDVDRRECESRDGASLADRTHLHEEDALLGG